MRSLLSLALALALSVPTQAAAVKIVDWNEPLTVRLLCSQTGMLICSATKPSCGTLQDLSFTDITVDLATGKARYVPIGDRDFDLQLVSTTIDERGHNGQIQATMGAAGLTIGFFRPSDTSAPISFSLTTAGDGRNQVMLGRCTRQ